MKCLQNKKVLFISSVPPPYGGIACWMKKIMDEGLSENYEVLLVDIKVPRKRQFFGDSSLSFKNKQLSISDIYRTIRIFTVLVCKIIKHYPDLVHLNCNLSAVGVFRDLLCAYIARLCRIPVVCHYRGSIPESLGKSYLNLSLRALNRLISLSQINIAINKPSLDYLLKVVDDKRCVKLSHFIPDDDFNYEVSGYGDNNRRKRAIFVGWIALAKGFAELVEVSMRLPDVDFDLIGLQTGSIEPFLKSLPANVNLYGEMNRAGIFKEMCGSDLFFFPSHSEGFPNVVLEAMAVGLPVVSTRKGAIPEMIDDGKGGYLFDSRDVSGFVKGIRTLIGNPMLRIRMGQYNREKCRSHYSFSIVIKQLTDLYDKVVNN